MTGVIEVRGLNKSYGSYAATRDVSFRVAEGHTLGLLGPSGCGKTTILRCIAGLETPDSGFISIGGHVVYDSQAGINLAPEKRELGVVFQSYAIWPHMTVAENVGFPLRIRGVPKAERDHRVAELLDVVGLAGFGGRSATQLSGGQQQRVALARALVHRSRLVLFDEALSNLDAQLREHMRVELKLLQQKLGFTAIYVTHDQAEAFGLAETVVLMNRGRIEAAGAARDIFGAPGSAFSARFFGLNLAPGRIERVDPPFAQIDLGQGIRVRGRLGTGEGRLRQGDDAILGIRREHVRLGDRVTAPSAGSELPDSYSGSVRATSFQGLSEELVITLGQHQLRAVQPLSNLRVNDTVPVRLKPEEVFIFPAEDGRGA
ncbi:ABC transporter ATP-binding protein [Roseomonas elaeocarpi]|uniref:ABC transporter ATP-binding protein n=1 Tax=Roseomonas elaeocarpi TaxID=907779 RepID=A0ABV6JQY3_9PROT